MNRRTFLSGLPAALALCGTPLHARSARATGIIFVGASWCPVCKQAAPILDVFARRHVIPVIVASDDGRPIAPFPDFVDTASHPIAKGVRAFPTTFVYSSLRDEVLGGVEGYRSPQWFLGNLLSLVRQSEGIS